MVNAGAHRVRSLLVIALVIAGCVKGPPARRARAEPIDCTSSYTAPVADTILAAALAAGAIALITSVRASDDPEACGGMCPMFLAQLVVGGPIAGIYAAHAYAQVHACRDAQTEIHAEITEDEAEATAQRTREDVRERAWQLTSRAQSDARAANCDAVRSASAKVAALDEEFHRAVFVRDVAIAHCLLPDSPESIPQH